MIDITLLRTDPDRVRRTVEAKESDVDVDGLISLDSEMRATQVQMETLRAEQKKLGKGADIDKARALKQDLKNATERFRELEKARDELWVRLPNLFAEDTPLGHSDEDNVELRAFGTPVPADENRSHDIIGERLGIFDMARGAEVAGNGFYYWKGDGARLAWAVFTYVQDFLVKRGFAPMLTPLLARERTLFGTGYLPFFADQIYQVADSDLALIGTSEQTLIGYYGDTIVDASEFPIKVTAFSPCFRTEAGSAGRSNRGGFRVHQFHKVEQIIICDPADSDAMLEECQQNVEDILTSLELPFRVVRVCLGDMGAPAYKKYDTEAWFPSFGAYKETHSNTNLWDYQARRFKIRFKGADGKTVLPHTISSTGITDRAVFAILENNLNDDGTVTVPEVLRPYLGGQDLIGKPTAG
ncbi:serine--tRNA ligase [Myceligenerans pegani]|uniref:Serine--tRNA ligase n=1 Tax=Myceligenerans pegani TaxID=2776917 RepID=A0ABR9MWG7_9MICO|nr:serine--tRNA ligase [Myceligenerans sp. TRM 65318]MBE1875728.1 serine--tRNA ligase [Myceligenerans sp. TRM 65318]MBE3017999.1 serine--tRNA ligase [Myceligenerans sp. TRM 65318]